MFHFRVIVSVFFSYREEDGQVGGVWCHPSSDQRGDWGRGEGGALPRAVHVPSWGKGHQTCRGDTDCICLLYYSLYSGEAIKKEMVKTAFLVYHIKIYSVCKNSIKTLRWNIKRGAWINRMLQSHWREQRLATAARAKRLWSCAISLFTIERVQVDNYMQSVCDNTAVSRDKSVLCTQRNEIRLN